MVEKMVLKWVDMMVGYWAVRKVVPLVYSKVDQKAGKKVGYLVVQWVENLVVT